MQCFVGLLQLSFMYASLSRTIAFDQSTDFMQVAWEVNFIRPLRYFKNSLQGLVNLINFSLSCNKQIHFVFCSSTASVAKQGDSPTPILELPSGDPTRAADLGYGRSKWVAEQICWKAQQKTVAQISVIRIGQLTGDTLHGIWNESEAWPLMFSTVYRLGCLPAIDETLTWLPLDIAAMAIFQITVNFKVTLLAQVKFYHVVNNSKETHWRDMLGWIQEFHQGPFRVVGYREWLEELDRLEDENPAKVLSTLWQNAEKAPKDIESPDAKCTEYLIQGTKLIAPIMLTVGPVDKLMIKKIWDWVVSVNAEKTQAPHEDQEMEDQCGKEAEESERRKIGVLLGEHDGGEVVVPGQ